MDGPYVCGTCDCGISPSGNPFTLSEASAYYARVREWRNWNSVGDPDHEFESIFGDTPDDFGVVECTCYEHPDAWCEMHGAWDISQQRMKPKLGHAPSK
jgi:hypothetical protein